MKQMTPERKAEELYTPHDNMFMAKRKAFVEGANWQSPTPEAVAVAMLKWTRRNKWERRADGWVKNKGKTFASELALFTLFTASPEYKELFK